MAFEKKIYIISAKLSPKELDVYFAAVLCMQQELEDVFMRGKEDTGFPEANQVIDHIRSL
jgi:hypothetical protein